MHKGAILSLLFAGIITGSYLEFRAHQSDVDADAPVVQAVVMSVERDEEAHPSPSVLEQFVSEDRLVVVHRPGMPTGDLAEHYVDGTA